MVKLLKFKNKAGETVINLYINMKYKSEKEKHVEQKSTDKTTLNNSYIFQ